jgi:hypothetical protein
MKSERCRNGKNGITTERLRNFIKKQGRKGVGVLKATTELCRNKDENLIGREDDTRGRRWAQRIGVPHKPNPTENKEMYTLQPPSLEHPAR